MAKRIKDGDVFEIKTANGLAYFQVVRQVSGWGGLVRVFWGRFSHRPEWENIARAGVQFLAFFPVGFAIKSGAVDYVCNKPADNDEYPDVFRTPGMIERDGKVKDWFIVEGDREYRVSALNAQTRKLPIKQVLNRDALVYYIESDWVVENEV